MLKKFNLGGAVSGRVVMGLLIVIIAVVNGIGCGTGSGTSSSNLQTSALTKAQFVKRANAICTEGLEQIPLDLSTYLGKHASDPGRSEGVVEAEAVKKTVLPKVKTKMEEIRALGSPSGDEEQVEAFLTSMQEAVESLESRKRLRSLAEDLGQAFVQESNLAREYGVSSCAFGPT